MEKAKISPYQLFVLILLFELGTALLVPLGIDANHNAWLAILLAMAGGFVLFLISHRLYLYYPDVLPTTYIQRLIGKVFGRILAFAYLGYFLYIASRALRDIGEMLTVIAYPETPLLINHTILVLVIVYTVRKGIEVIARTGEIFFFFIYFLAMSGFVLIFISGLCHFYNLTPILEDGIYPVIKVAFGKVLFFPFGEVIVFAMILPYLNHPKKARLTGILALGLSGINLAITMAINISVLGVSQIKHTQFPLMSTIQMIQFAEFLERLDVFYILAMVVLGFFKIAVYFYAAVIGSADLFKIKQPSQLAFPFGFIVLFMSITIASNVAEHFQESLEVIPFFLHVPFQVGIPMLLLLIAFYKNRKKS